MSFVTEITLKRSVEAQERRYNEMLDAAEFEIKCREYLWGKDVEDAPCAHGCRIFCPAPKAIVKKGDCLKWCMLREARLKVESEMD